MISNGRCEYLLHYLIIYFDRPLQILAASTYKRKIIARFHQVVILILLTDAEEISRSSVCLSARHFPDRDFLFTTAYSTSGFTGT